jgi:hypothetical protein
MKLQRVAVADRQPGVSLELQRLGPTSAVDVHPVVGLSLRVCPFRLVPGWLVLRNETLSVTEAPCCLSSRARSLDNHDHVAMIVHIASNPECRSFYRWSTATRRAPREHCWFCAGTNATMCTCATSKPPDCCYGPGHPRTLTSSLIWNLAGT